MRFFFVSIKIIRLFVLQPQAFFNGTYSAFIDDIFLHVITHIVSYFAIRFSPVQTNIKINRLVVTCRLIGILYVLEYPSYCIVSVIHATFSWVGQQCKKYIPLVKSIQMFCAKKCTLYQFQSTT